MDAGTFDISMTAPAEDGELVPFRPENRMTTFLVVAVLLLCCLAVWCVKIITNSPNPNSTPAWAFAGASVLIAAKILLSMLQLEFARRGLSADISKTRHDLRQDLNAASLKMDEVVRKTNGGLTKAVEEVGEQVRRAEHSQMMDDEDFRSRLAEKLCPLLAKQIAHELRNPEPPQVQT